MPALPALLWAAQNEEDKYVKRKAIEIVGEIGGMQGIVAIGRTVLQPANGPEIVKACENSLLKLLPAVGSRLSMGEAIFLWEVYRAKNKRISPAIDRAWAAAGITHQAIAQVVIRRELVAQSKSRAQAEEIEIQKKIQHHQDLDDANPRWRCEVLWSDGSVTNQIGVGSLSRYIGAYSLNDGVRHSQTERVTEIRGDGKVVGRYTQAGSQCTIVNIAKTSRVKLSEYWQPPRPTEHVPTESELEAAGRPTKDELEAAVRWMFQQ